MHAADTSRQGCSALNMSAIPPEYGKSFMSILIISASRTALTMQTLYLYVLASAAGRRKAGVVEVTYASPIPKVTINPIFLYSCSDRP